MNGRRRFRFKLKEKIVYQHCCSKVKLLLELCDEYVYRDEVPLVIFLHFSDNIGQPLKLFLCPGNPQKINLEDAKEFHCDCNFVDLKDLQCIYIF